MAALTVLTMAGCAPQESLLVGVGEADVVAPEQWDKWGPVLRIPLRLENRGEATVHVFTDLLQVLGENGSRGTVREFRDLYRIQHARTPAGERGRVESVLAVIGIQEDQMRELTMSQIPVLPGQTLQRTLPFLLKGGKADTRYSLDFASHDDATDRITRLTLSVTVK